MTTPYRAHADPPITLTDRVRQLNDNLQDLALRLKDAIATAVGRAVAQAVRDGVNALLGAREEHPDPKRFDGRPQADRRAWDDEDAPWFDPAEEVVPPAQPARPAANRWKEAGRAALQTALWWLRQQPRRRPILTTTLVAVAAGSVALVAGPGFAACVSVIASIASLLLTDDSARSAADLLAA